MAADTDATPVPTSSPIDPLTTAFEGLIADQLAAVVALTTQLSQLRSGGVVPPLPPVEDP